MPLIELRPSGFGGSSKTCLIITCSVQASGQNAVVSVWSPVICYADLWPLLAAESEASDREDCSEIVQGNAASRGLRHRWSAAVCAAGSLCQETRCSLEFGKRAKLVRIAHSEFSELPCDETASSRYI